MKRKLKVVIVAGIIVLGCAFIVHLGASHGSGSSGSEEVSESSSILDSEDGSDGTVSLSHRAELVTIIGKYAKGNLPGVVVPDILDDSQWSYYYDADLGYYSVVCTAKDSTGADYLITAWISLDGDTYAIHYLHAGEQDLIDDGTVPD